jgi:hypothetical protein
MARQAPRETSHAERPNCKSSGRTSQGFQRQLLHGTEILVDCSAQKLGVGRGQLGERDEIVERHAELIRRYAAIGPQQFQPTAAFFVPGASGPLLHAPPGARQQLRDLLLDCRIDLVSALHKRAVAAIADAPTIPGVLAPPMAARPKKSGDALLGQRIWDYPLGESGFPAGPRTARTELAPSVGAANGCRFLNVC